MGDKIEARGTVLSIGVPVIRGSQHILTSFDEAAEIAEKIGYPVFIKASAGGGGMGMKVAYDPAELEINLEKVQKTAMSLYGDDSVFVEKYIERPRHIEVQVIGDHYGNYVHLGERECSIQRRHQKVVEEAPSTALTAEMRERICDAAVKIADSVGYNSVGTVEFIYADGEFYFLEMNTRVQVEHTITEMITGIDIVKTQIEIASGKPLGLKQDYIRFNGHAIECRICAEDPLKGFMSSPGLIEGYIAPGGYGVRVDSGVYAGYEVSSYYDSMLSKVVTWGNNRIEAINRMYNALDDYRITGPKNTIPFLMAIMKNEDFKRMKISTKFIEEHPALFEETARYVERAAKTKL